MSWKYLVAFSIHSQESKDAQFIRPNTQNERQTMVLSFSRYQAL